jgi:hypothetical protein
LKQHILQYQPAPLACQPFGEIAVQTIFYDDSCFGPNPGLKNYIPCCPRIALTSTTVADCFSDNQGNVTFEWDLFYGADETPTSITIFRSSGVFGNETTVLTPSYGEFENGWIDTGLILPTTCVSDVDVEYTITFEWAEDATGAPVTDFVATVVTIPCCYQDCGDITNGCDLCWAKEDSNLKVYLESYFEDPLKTPKEASFQIKYCIDDACALGISDAEVYITLPAGVTVTRFESLASTYGTISFEESFANGVYPGRWKFTVLRTPGSAIEELLQPTYGVLGDVYFDKPLGDNVACIHEDTSVTVVVADTPITSPPTEDPTPIVYEEENNLSLTESPADPTKSWQTGPCLSTCTDELDIGFGDFHFSMDAVDNSIFDVKYCLTQGSIDSFVLVCLTGDFKTKVTSIDTEFGDAIARGWKVGFRNLSPGFTLIYGRGARPIPTSGISTLIRVYLDNDIIQRNPSGEESCLCIFPLFTNLGSLFSKVESYIANFGTQPSVALKDSEIVGGTTEASYSPTPITTSGAIGTSATRDTGSSLTPLPPATISTSINSDFTPATFAGYQVGSGFLADLEVIAANIDERFLPLVNCLTVSFGRVITDWQNTEEYARDRGTLDNAIKTAHYFRIFFTIWTALLRSIPNLAAKFKNSAQTIDDSCTNGVGIIFECDDSSPKNISCHITYDLSLCASSGIEFDLSDFQTFVDDAGNGVSLEDSLSWTGDASDKNYIQVYSPTSGKYITVYGADLAQRTDTDTKIDYLRTDSSSPSYQHLTTIKLSISDYTDWGGDQATFENTICPIVFAAKDNDGTWAGLATLSDYDKFVELRNAIKVGLNKVRIVSNEKGTTPTAQWTGNSFAPSGLQSIDVKDFLTTLVNVVEPATFDLSEENLESIIKLPTSAGTKTLKQFYNLNDINLSGVTYAPNGTDAYKDPSGNFILPTIDANGDGKIDIVDLVALRNTWLYSNQYPLSNTATISARQIVPNDCCAKLDLDVEILVADDCSQFCIQPPCFGKVWLSDMLLIKDQFGRPDKYILEVSYGVNCSDETVSEVDYPVQDISGVQFRIQGLTNAGIVSSINGFGVEEGKTATAIKAKEWSEHILSSDTITKDTYISFSTNGKYINKGKGILCYLVVDPSSIPDAESYLADRFEEEYITTNKFIKFENSPDVVGISEVAGSKIGYPLANLRLGSHHTDELLIFERFGIRTTEYKLSSNRYYNVDDPSGPYVNMTSAPAVSWTGDRTGDGIGDSDLTYVLQLAATKTYEEQFDANASGKIDILDVQAVSNTINDQVFNYGADVVPRYCCDIGELITPVISVTDYTAGEVIIPVVQNGKIREVTLNGSSLGCGASAENQGGVLLYWDTLRYADYYVVYRKGQNDTSAIPIIAAGPGNRNRIGSFPTEDRSAERDPISILPNMWIDYPPIKEDDCCSLANFDVGAYFSGDVATAVTTEIETRLGTTITPGATSEAFTYWIVAISREGEVRSVERDGSVSCCSFDPISSDVFIATTTNTQFSAKFDAYHPLASRPIGAADQTSGEALPVWFFPQNSINGKGREGISDKGGTVVTDSKLPDRLDASGANQRGFVYTPKPNFVGKDTFKYITTIVDIKNRFRPSTWCKSISTVTAYVSPPAPLLLARAGSNSIPSEKDKAFLSWSNSKGATSYKLYRDTVLIDTIPAENEKTNRYRYTDTTPNLPVCPAPATPVKNTYEISSVYLDPDGTEIESSKNSTTVTFVCPPDLDTTSTVINLTQVGFNIPIGGTKLSTGTVVVSWGAVANADYYSVFRKETTSSDWIFRGKTNTPTFRDNIPSCNECSPATQSYDYYITAFSRGYQSDPSPDVTTVIPCYDAFPPQVSDKSGTVEERQTLSSSVSARAVQGTISVYSVVTPPASDSGTLTFLPDGTFTFAAALNFIGNTQFEWQAQDSCGNTSSALFTINVTATPVDDESNYTISSITKLTSQQNTRGIRQRNATISQVPFVLNNKGAPSLRKRCSAFSITRGVDPSTWAPSSDGCGIPLDANLDPGDTCVDPTIGTAIIGTSEIGECE